MRPRLSCLPLSARDLWRPLARCLAWTYSPVIPRLQTYSRARMRTDTPTVTAAGHDVLALHFARPHELRRLRPEDQACEADQRQGNVMDFRSHCRPCPLRAL